MDAGGSGSIIDSVSAIHLAELSYYDLPKACGTFRHQNKETDRVFTLDALFEYF